MSIQESGRKLLRRASSRFNLSSVGKRRSVSFEPDYDPSVYWKRKILAKINNQPIPRHLQITPEGQDQKLLTEYVDRVIHSHRIDRLWPAMYASGLAGRFDLINKLLGEFRFGDNRAIDSPIRIALNGAIVGGYCELTKELLKLCPPDDHSSMLCLAAEEGQFNIVVDMLKLDIGKHDDGINRAISKAIGNGHPGIVSELINHISDAETEVMVQKRRFDLNIAIITAIKHNQQELIQVLIDSATQSELDNALRWGIKWCYPSIVKEILIHRGDELDLDGALVEASIQGNTENVLLLIEYGANNVNEALRIAREHKHSALVKRLVILILELLTTKLIWRK